MIQSTVKAQQVIRWSSGSDFNPTMPCHHVTIQYKQKASASNHSMTFWYSACHFTTIVYTVLKPAKQIWQKQSNLHITSTYTSFTPYDNNYNLTLCKSVRIVKNQTLVGTEKNNRLDSRKRHTNETSDDTIATNNNDHLLSKV